MRDRLHANTRAMPRGYIVTHTHTQTHVIVSTFQRVCKRGVHVYAIKTIRTVRVYIATYLTTIISCSFHTRYIGATQLDPIPSDYI